MNGELEQGWLYQDSLNPVAELDGDGSIVSVFVYGTRGNVPDYMVSCKQSEGCDEWKTYRLSEGKLQYLE